MIERALSALALCAAALAQGCGGAKAEPLGSIQARLESGRALESSLDLSTGREALFTIDVKADARALRVELLARDVECELALEPGEFDGAEAPLRVPTELGRAVARVDRLGEPRIAAGLWRVVVRSAGVGLAHAGSSVVAKIPFSIRADLFGPRTDAALEAGRLVDGRVGPKNGGFWCARIDVPDGAPALRVDVANTDGDVDLVLRRGAAFTVHDASVAIAEHAFGRESIRLDAGTSPKLEAGPWFLDVVDPLALEIETRFSLLASFATDAPPALRGVAPFAPARDDALANAARSVVEVVTDTSSGSAVCVSKTGLFLTNAHVVGAIGGGVSRDIALAIQGQGGEPARENFRARVAAFDGERDLALLEVDSGFRGEPIPPDFVFPALELGRSPPIGAALWLVGFPATGGQRGRVTQSITRGIVSGFERTSFGATLKTDAEIASGSSGGAALDERGRLIGLPTSLVESGASQIGYVVTIEALPPEWRARFER